MQDFRFEEIQVRLADSRRIAMVIRRDHSPDDYVVVFADREKLRPLIVRVAALLYPTHFAFKIRDARQGIASAVIPSGNFPFSENPLPMAIVGPDYRDGIGISFGDGVTRTHELVNMGADFIPLQAEVERAQYIQDLVGGSRPYEMASRYVVAPDVRQGRLNAHYDRTIAQKLGH